jgi:hypothetical protein
MKIPQPFDSYQYLSIFHLQVDESFFEQKKIPFYNFSSAAVIRRMNLLHICDAMLIGCNLKMPK